MTHLPFVDHDQHGPALRENASIEACHSQHRQLQFEVARYIELVLGELCIMAKAADLGHLLHCIDLTRQEAGDQTQRCRIEG